MVTPARPTAVVLAFRRAHLGRNPARRRNSLLPSAHVGVAVHPARECRAIHVTPRRPAQRSLARPCPPSPFRYCRSRHVRHRKAHPRPPLLRDLPHLRLHVQSQVHRKDVRVARQRGRLPPHTPGGHPSAETHIPFHRRTAAHVRHALARDAPTRRRMSRRS